MTEVASPTAEYRNNVCYMADDHSHMAVQGQTLNVRVDTDDYENAAGGGGMLMCTVVVDDAAEGGGVRVCKVVNDAAAGGAAPMVCIVGENGAEGAEQLTCTAEENGAGVAVVGGRDTAGTDLDSNHGAAAEPGSPESSGSDCNGGDLHNPADSEA